MKQLQQLVLILLPILVITACAETRYASFSEGKEAVPLSPARTVMVEIDKQYYEKYPDCVVVMPPSGAADLKQISKMVESSLALHLTRKISRVISGAKRDLAANRMAVDLVHPGDRDFFMDKLECDVLVTTEVLGPGKSYYVVWSQVRVGLDVKMIRARDQRLLWRARHIADRSEGGIPFTPFGVVMDGYSSTKFSADREIVESVVDDAVRRIVASLPDGVLQ